MRSESERTIVGIPNPDRPVYRFFELHRLMDVYKRRKLVLRAPHTWDDQLENFLRKSRGRLRTTGQNPRLSGIFGRYYGQSWTWCDDDSDLLWRLFAPSRQGVRVMSTPRRLLEAIFDPDDPFAQMSYLVGAVRYVDQKTLFEYFSRAANATSVVLDPTGQSQLRSLLLKKVDFSHEQEVRVLYFDAEGRRAAGDSCEFDIDPFTLFDELLFDPRLQPEHFRFYTGRVEFEGKLIRAQHDAHRLGGSQLEHG